jgi:hypothetical protein
MGNVPVQPERISMAARAAGAVAAVLGDGSEFVVAGYRKVNTALPASGGGGSGDSLPAVRVQIGPPGGSASGGRWRGAAAGNVGASRIGLANTGAMGGSMNVPGGLARSGGQGARLCVLAKLPLGFDLGGATVVRGTVDLGDGLGARVITLGMGDELYVPGEAVGLPELAEATLKVGQVGGDAGLWMAECGA